MYCSIYQALLIWDDLRDAMEHKASHGYDAEIYAYRLMPNIPSNKITTEDNKRAAKSLVVIIDIFKERYPNAYFLIDGLECNYWVKKYGCEFSHRVKVQWVL